MQDVVGPAKARVVTPDAKTTGGDEPTAEGASGHVVSCAIKSPPARADEKKQRSLGRGGCRGVRAAGACTEGKRDGKKSAYERPAYFGNSEVERRVQLIYRCTPEWQPMRSSVQDSQGTAESASPFDDLDVVISAPVAVFTDL